jgi:hypothetical protein
MQLKVGTRLRSVADTTEIVVVRAPADDVDLRCGGHPMAAHGGDGPADGEVAAGFDGGTLVGKRYVDDEAGLEVLCTKAGGGTLSVGETALALKEAKPLPSSD